MSVTDLQNSMEILYGHNFYFYLILLVDLTLKGFALWKSARLKEKNWFWAILLVNSAGLLPAFYLFIKRNVKTD